MISLHRAAMDATPRRQSHVGEIQAVADLETLGARPMERTVAGREPTCMLGGEDGRTLYIVANRYGPSGASDGIVLTQPVAVPHAGRP